jgi:RNA polymerase sigma-70 factor, ECF subfamily
MMSGDTAALSTLLAEDAVFYSDGGGKRRAALNPIYGRDKIVRFFEGIKNKGSALVPVEARPARINGLPGFVVVGEQGPETISIETSGDLIVALYFVRNPDKLRHLS